jgi:hypothetical protein
MTREYSSISVQTTLNSGINTTATTMTVPSIGAATALLGGVTLDPGNVDIFTVAIDHDTVNEEIVFITGVSGDTFTISRGQAGTGTAGVSGIAHNAGASIKHVLTSSDLIFYTAGVATANAAVTPNSAQVLTNKDLTSGTNTFPSSFATLTGTQTLTNKDLSSGTNTFPSSFATLTGSQTLTNKTLTAPVLISPEERTTVSATAATGTINFDALTQGVLYYTSNASASFTLNVRGSSGATLNSILATGDAITIVFLNTNGATPYYPTAYQIDGSSVTPKWQGGTAPTGGNASSIDAYSLTIIKTASTPTYTVLASQTKFA